MQRHGLSVVHLGDASWKMCNKTELQLITRNVNVINIRKQFSYLYSYSTHTHTNTKRASTLINRHCLLKANPLKWTECELTASSERLTSATFLTSYYWENRAAGSLELCTHNHKFTHSHKTKGIGINTWKMHTETFIWARGIITFLPDILPSVCQ